MDTLPLPSPPRAAAGSSDALAAARTQLLTLATRLGADPRLTLRGQGAVAGQLDDDGILVSADGAGLADLSEEGLVPLRRTPLLEVIESDEPLHGAGMRRLLHHSQAISTAPRPGLDAFVHGWLLTLPGVRVVAYCQPTTAMQLLCTDHARRFAQRRLFPDQVTYCGASSVLVPYTEPGVELAREVAHCVLAFTERFRTLPRTILVENYGLIGVGPSPEAVASAMEMTEKAARIYAGAAVLGEPNFLPAHHVALIAGRPLDRPHAAPTGSP